MKGTKSLSLIEPASLLVRLRAGFGIGVKSDILALLLGMGGSMTTAKRMVDALNYSRMAIHTAVRGCERNEILVVDTVSIAVNGCM